MVMVFFSFNGFDSFSSSSFFATQGHGSVTVVVYRSSRTQTLTFTHSLILNLIFQFGSQLSKVSIFAPNQVTNSIHNWVVYASLIYVSANHSHVLSYRRFHFNSI